MYLLAGTRDGVYRCHPETLDDATRVLETDRVMRVRRFGQRIYAATRSGLYRSLDDGESWTHVETPREEVYSVLEHPVGDRLYAGTHPAHLYVSTEVGDTSAAAGESWTECAGLQDLPSRDSWHTPRHRNEAHARSLGAVGSGRLLAGIEVGGVHLSEDDCETWEERRDGVHDDVHHVLVRGEDHWVASTGNGLYRTRDTGRTWTRLDRGLDHRYFREAFAHDGRLYAAAAAGAPPSWGGADGADAALFESDDDGETFESVDYDGGPGEFVLSWTAAGGGDRTGDAGGGDVYAGTTGGSVLRRDAGTERWVRIGTLPSGVASLLAVGTPGTTGESR